MPTQGEGESEDTAGFGVTVYWISNLKTDWANVKLDYYIVIQSLFPAPRVRKGSSSQKPNNIYSITQDKQILYYVYDV